MGFPFSVASVRPLHSFLTIGDHLIMMSLKFIFVYVIVVDCSDDVLLTFRFARLPHRNRGAARYAGLWTYAQVS